MKFPHALAMVPLCVGAFADAVYLEPAPMLSRSAVETEKLPGPPAWEVEQIIRGHFTSSYERQGSPSIALFWNRKFDDQMSQWYAARRRGITGESGYEASDVLRRTGNDDDAEGADPLAAAVQSLDMGGADSGSYDRSVKGGSRILASEYDEARVDVEGRFDQRAGLNEVDQFAFDSGFTQQFIQSGARILDRDAIMRLVERDLARDAGAEIISDYQKLEADALVGYADYFAEILFSEGGMNDLDLIFLVSVKEVSSGRVVAMFRTHASPAPEAVVEKWVPTDTGYEKRTVPLPKSQSSSGWRVGPNGYEASYGGTADGPESPEVVGKRLALETMQALTRFWQ